MTKAASPEEIRQRIENAYSVIKGRKDGILQSELWKVCNIDSRTCSRVLKTLEDEGRVYREPVKGNTYVVKAVKKEKTVDPMLLMAGEVIVPCVACTEECDVPNCKMLEDWIYELVFSQMN